MLVSNQPKMGISLVYSHWISAACWISATGSYMTLATAVACSIKIFADTASQYSLQIRWQAIDASFQGGCIALHEGILCGVIHAGLTA